MHVILRGIDRGAVFFEDDDRRFFLAALATAAAEEIVAVHAYVLMTNHVHLLLTAKLDEGVAAVMKRVGQRYVQHVNRTYRRSGGLFEGRFRSSLKPIPTCWPADRGYARPAHMEGVPRTAPQ